MKITWTTTSLLLATLASLTALAQKSKIPDASTFPIWEAPKRGLVVQYVPGLTAVLQLTDTQKEQLAEAREELLNTAPMQAARRANKSDPGVTKADKDASRQAQEDAAAQWKEIIELILTPDQKELRQKITELYANTGKEVAKQYESRFVGMKGDNTQQQALRQTMREETDKKFQEALDALLNPAQKLAMAEAAEKEKERAIAAALLKKPAK